MRAFEIISETSINIDNENGLGQVPNNTVVDYMGLRTQMLPATFLSLARKLSAPDQKSLSHLTDHLKQGGSIGSPFLLISMPDKWLNGELDGDATVVGHEGRHRMYAVQEVAGNLPIEVHLFFPGGWRARHLTQDIVEHLIKGMISENGTYVPGPLFKTTIR